MIEYNVKKRVSSSSISTTIPLDKPMIFWDTCSLLYIISIPLREAFGEFNLYSQILQLIENGQVISVTSAIVHEEFKQHAQEIFDNTLKDEKKLVKVYKQYADCIAEPDKTQIREAADKLKLSDILVDISNRVWKNTYIINEDSLYQGIAHYRVMNKMSPAFTKGEYKDSYIWASFMDTCQKLGDASFHAFMTNNTDDYCDYEGKKVKDVQNQIKLDCNTVSAKFYWKTGELYSALRAVLGM